MKNQEFYMKIKLLLDQDRMDDRDSELIAEQIIQLAEKDEQEDI